MIFILSRKGFDSENGGYPSPILEDGRLISIPIPSHTREELRYSNLRLTKGTKMTYFDLLSQLGRKIKNEGENEILMKETRCHSDPDIYKNILRRKKGWRGCFGQAGAAQRHLEPRIGKNDVFLFFGTFKKAVEKEGKYAFDESSHSKHVIFGYLQLDRKFHPNSEKEEPWMESHPHILHKGKDKKNTIYVATKRLTWNKNLPGWGVFDFNRELVLTKEGYSKSKWKLPQFFRDVEITYHSQNSWKKDYFQSVDKGQELIIQEDAKVTEWAKALIDQYAKRDL